MTQRRGKFGIEVDTPELVIIEMLFHYTVLCEYQLLDLQASVRGFVDRMSKAVSDIDGALGSRSAPARAALEALRAELASGKATFTREEVARFVDALGPCVEAHDAVQGDVYTLIECLSFEDIQSQRLDHLARASSALNMGIIERLRRGIQNASVEEMVAFAQEMARKTRAMYTMPAERDVYDQVFLEFMKGGDRKAV